MWLPIDTDAFVFLPFYAFNKKLKKKSRKNEKRKGKREKNIKRKIETQHLW